MADRKALYLVPGSNTIKEVNPLSDGLSASEFVLNSTSNGMGLTEDDYIVFTDSGGIRVLDDLGDTSFNITGSGASGSDYILLRGGLLRHNSYIYATYGGSSYVWNSASGVGINVEYQIGSQEIDGTPKANNTAYWLYIDTQFLPTAYVQSSSGVSTSLFVRLVSTSNFAYSQSIPESGLVNVDRFIPVGVFSTDGSGNFNTNLKSYLPVTPKQFDTTWQWRNIGYVTKKNTYYVGGSQTYTHNIGITPDVIQLTYFDGSSYTPLNTESYVSNVTDLIVSFNFTGLTFTGVEFVQMMLAWYQESFNSPVNSWESNWISSNAVSTFTHTLKKIPSAFSLIYNNNGTYESLDIYAYLNNFTDTLINMVWGGLTLDSTHQVKIYASTGAIPYGNPFKTVMQDYTNVGTVGTANQQFAGHTFILNESGTGTDLALYLFSSSGALLTDSTSNSYTLVNSTSVAVSGGIFGGSSGAAYLDGSNYLYQSTLLNTMPSNAVDIDLWINVDNGQPTTSQYLFKKINNTSSDYMFAYINSSGKIVFKTKQNGASIRTLTSNTTLPNGITGYYYLNFTWDTINGMQLSVNGTIEVYDRASITLMSDGTDGNFLIGANTGGTNIFSGNIGMFRVRNKILIGKKDFDLAYSTKYPKPSNFIDDDFIITAYIQEDGDSNYESELGWGGMEVNRNLTSIYRYGGLFNSADNIRLVARY